MTGLSGTTTLRRRHAPSSNQNDGEDSAALFDNTDSNITSTLGDDVRECNKGNLHNSLTELPWQQENGEPAIEKTTIPSKSNTAVNNSTKKNKNETPTGEMNSESSSNKRITSITRLALSQSSSIDDDILLSPENEARGSTGTTPNSQQHKKKEKGRLHVRIISACCMMACFCMLLYMGHLYICALVALCELLLFRELVKVRYHVHFDTIHDTIPLFRTTQWMWFAVAIFYTYGDFILEIIQNNPKMHYLLTTSLLFPGEEGIIPGLNPGMQYSLPTMAFCLYSCAFVITIATLQVGHIKFQLNQLCWTIVVLCLTVGQLKYIMHNIYNGLIWFLLPIMLVISNDIMAYVCGMTWGRKFIQKPFYVLSPNKTWEGFIGAWICTMILSWWWSKLMIQFKWMTCPTNEFTLFPEPLDCDVHHLFKETNYIFPSQVFDLLPRWVVKMMPNVVEICSVKNSAETELTRCISGEDSHIHHHFELTFRGVYPMQIHALWLALFASWVAPFGGFLASAIKRAYGIKDFDSIIPGHGGLMDRFDCQLLMALCTWVHYNTFVKLANISVPKLVYMYSLLSENEKIDFLNHISNMESGSSMPSPSTNYLKFGLD